MITAQTRQADTLAREICDGIRYTDQRNRETAAQDLAGKGQRHAQEVRDRPKTTPRQHFADLLERLSPEAQKCDIGLYVKEAAGAFVNDFREGRTLTIKERHQWLHDRLHESRGGRWEPVTLARLFPDDARTIQEARP